MFVQLRASAHVKTAAVPCFHNMHPSIESRKNYIFLVRFVCCAVFAVLSVFSINGRLTIRFSFNRRSKCKPRYQDQAASGEERFVAVHAPHPDGAIEHLRPDLVALANMAVAYLPASYRFGSVIAATRELVNGVRYQLLFSATEAASGEPVVCETVVLERPWVLVGPFQKQRELLQANCTADGAAENEDAAAGNAADDFSFNPVFVNQGGVEDADVMRQLEAQIVPATKPRTTKKPLVPTKPTPTTAGDFDASALDEALRLIEKDILPLQRAEQEADRRPDDNASALDEALHLIEKVILPLQPSQQEAARRSDDISDVGFDVVDCPHLMNHVRTQAEPTTVTLLEQQLADIESTLRTAEQAIQEAATAKVAMDVEVVPLTDTQKRVLDAIFGVDTVDVRPAVVAVSSPSTQSNETPTSTESTTTSTTTLESQTPPTADVPREIPQSSTIESATDATDTSSSSTTSFSRTDTLDVSSSSSSTTEFIPYLDVRFADPEADSNIVDSSSTSSTSSTSTTTEPQADNPTEVHFWLDSQNRRPRTSSAPNNTRCWRSAFHLCL